MGLKHDEVEVKFEASGLDWLRLQHWFITNERLRWDNWKPAVGSDAYWRCAGSSTPVRLRFDNATNSAELTVKVRKSDASILERHEVNLALQPSVALDSARAFLKLAGWSEEFEVQKVSDILRVSAGAEKYCVALYDVWLSSRPTSTRRRFLEIELETATDPLGVARLRALAEEVRAHFDLQPAVNYSLYEYFSKVAAGELPGQAA